MAEGDNCGDETHSYRRGRRGSPVVRARFRNRAPPRSPRANDSSRVDGELVLALLRAVSRNARLFRAYQESYPRQQPSERIAALRLQISRIRATLRSSAGNEAQVAVLDGFAARLDALPPNAPSQKLDQLEEDFNYASASDRTLGARTTSRRLSTFCRAAARICACTTRSRQSGRLRRRSRGAAPVPRTTCATPRRGWSVSSTTKTWFRRSSGLGGLGRLRVQGSHRHTT